MPFANYNPDNPLGIFPGDQDWQKRFDWRGTPAAPAQPTSWADKIAQGLGSPGAQLGLNILANNQRGKSFGEIIGGGALGFQQQQAQASQADLQRKLIEAQIARMNTPDAPQQRAPVIVMGADGKPRYEDPANAIGQQPYQQPPGQSSDPSEVVISRILNDPNTSDAVKKDLRELIDKKYRDPAAEPLVAIQTPDGRSVLVPRSQAAGASPAAARENFVPTEGERTAGNYFGRMEAAEKLLGDYQPSTTDYIAADRMMKGGPTTGSLANLALSEAGQRYYQAAADWVRAKLRKESGAVIAPEEMAQEIKTYFPMPGDGVGVRKQKAQARQQAMQGMRDMGGRAVEPPQSSGGIPNANDPLGIR